MIDIESRNPNLEKLFYLDPEWMCILKKTDKLLNVNSYSQAPIASTENVALTESDYDEIKEDFQECYEIPANFKVINNKFFVGPTFSATPLTTLILSKLRRLMLKTLAHLTPRQKSNLKIFT